MYIDVFIFMLQVNFFIKLMNYIYLNTCDNRVHKKKKYSESVLTPMLYYNCVFLHVLSSSWLQTNLRPVNRCHYN